MKKKILLFTVILILIIIASFITFKSNAIPPIQYSTYSITCPAGTVPQDALAGRDNLGFVVVNACLSLTTGELTLGYSTTNADYAITNLAGVVRTPVSGNFTLYGSNSNIANYTIGAAGAMGLNWINTGFFTFNSFQGNGNPALNNIVSINGASGSIKLNSNIINGTTFTATGCGTPTLLAGGATAGKFVGNAASCTVVITMGQNIGSPTGWFCQFTNLTHPATNIFQTSSTSGTDGTAGGTCTATGTITSGDTIVFEATGY